MICVIYARMKKDVKVLKAMRLIKKLFFAVAILFSFMNMQCESNEDELIIDTDNLVLGYWEASAFESDKITFKRGVKLPDDGFGVQFKTKGQLVEYAAGWGATPPLTFSSRNGKWELIDNTIAVTQEHFPNNYTWKIETLTTTELVVTRTLTAQEEAHVALLEMFKAVEMELEGVACEEVSEWGITGYGAKACGGSQGYVGYPKTIDTTAFLNLVDVYTKAEQAYNEKWGVFSTCEVIAPPTMVSCVDGVPVLQ